VLTGANDAPGVEEEDAAAGVGVGKLYGGKALGRKVGAVAARRNHAEVEGQRHPRASNRNRFR